MPTPVNYFFVNILVLTTTIFSCGGCSFILSTPKLQMVEKNVISFNTSNEIKKLINAELPNGISDLHYFKSKPSDQLDFYTAYIKFMTSKAEFLELMKRMNMRFRKVGGEANPYLPAVWKSDSLKNLPWWNPSLDTPDDAAAKSFGFNGWIVAKYENNYVYMIVTDTGYSEENTTAPSP